MPFFLRYAFLGLILSLPAWAVPPGEDWITFKTEHFHVHHTELQQKFAHAFANALERSFPLLTRDLAWTPRTPFDVVINDQSDAANGFALSVPSNRMEIYAVPFPTESSLMDYDNWVEELATHELTHIIANDTGFGAYKTLRSVFGSIVKPNGLQPVWLIEGLAVFEETQFGTGGRGRSLFTEALLRTINTKLDNSDYISLSKLNDGIFWWPGGNTSYLVGYAVQAASEGEGANAEAMHLPRYGNEEQSTPGMFSTHNANRPPYRLQTNLREILGQDWDKVWNKTVDHLQARYKATATDDDNPAFCKLTQGGRFTGGQALANDGWIYFSQDHQDEGSSLARVKADGDCHKPNVEILAEKKYGGPAQVSVSPDGKKVLFSETEFADSFHAFYELKLYDVDHRSLRKLNGQRGFDPAFIDNEQLVFVRNIGDGRQALSRLEIKEGAEPVNLLMGDYFHRFSHPFVAQGQVFFSRHNNAGQDEILKIPLQGGAPTPAIFSKSFNKGLRFVEQSPFVDSDGTIYFSGSYSGDGDTRSMDIYAFGPKDLKPRKLAQSQSGFLVHPIVYADGMIVANYGLQGFDLVRLNISDKEKLLAKLPQQKQALHEQLVASKTDAPTPGQSSANAEIKESNAYSFLSSPAASLWPHYWLPAFEIIPDGYYLGAQTSGGDPLDQHTYDVTALYDSRASFPVYTASYTNWYFPVGLSLFARQSNSYLQGTRLSNRVSLYALEATIPSDPWSFHLGFAYQQRTFQRIRTNSPFAFTDIVYHDARKTPSAIALNRGLNFNSYLAYYPSTNLETEFVDWRPELSFYVPGVARSHSVGTALRAGLSTNQFLASNYYLGGGIAALGDASDYVVRGYPSDVLLGQRILNANFSYTLPLSRPYKGWSTNPFFFKEFGTRFLADAGTANYTARYDGLNFLGYEYHPVGGKILYGLGLELLFNNTLLYYVPLQVTIGVHHGMQKLYGGDTAFYFGLNVNVPGLTHSKYQ